MATLREEQDAFERLLPELLQEHRGEFVVVHDGDVAGLFETYDEAYSFALHSFGLKGSFLISEVIEQNPAPASVSWYAGVMFG